MYRVILYAAATLVANAVQSATADQTINEDWCALGRGDDTITACDRVLALDPKDAKAYVNRGNAYNHKGDYDHAIADYDQAIQINPADDRAYNDRGAAHARKGDYDRAIADANEAIRLDPKYSYAYVTRGEAYEAKNDPDHAIADFDQALQLDPSLAKAREGFERVQPLSAKRSNPGTQTSAPPR